MLQKFPGKGGWTYVLLPKITSSSGKAFSWMKVHGSIDTYELKDYTLMPYGEGKLFLPVKAEIRKKIKKEAGDTVHITLYTTKQFESTSDDLLICIKEDKTAWLIFSRLPVTHKKKLSDYVNNAANDDIKVSRIGTIMESLADGTISRFLEKKLS